MSKEIKHRLVDSWRSTVIGVAALGLLGWMAHIDPNWRNPATLLAIIPAVFAILRKDGLPKEPSDDDEQQSDRK